MKQHLDIQDIQNIIIIPPRPPRENPPRPLPRPPPTGAVSIIASPRPGPGGTGAGTMTPSTNLERRLPSDKLHCV